MAQPSPEQSSIILGERSNHKDYISITELTQRLNTALELQFPKVKCIGEIAEIMVAKSGHIYFKLKDQNSQVDAVMWKGVAATLKIKPERGMKVLCEGKPNIYSGSGKFQIVVSSMSLAGEGELLRKFLELKARLEKEGLFAAERKRPIPFFPKAVGIVTSGTGAVIHDIMVRIKERMPFLETYLVDVKVQGEGASREIVEGIQLLNDFGKVDVIIVGRGGGSLEDLWAFNEEIVVRAIVASKIPVISSVGHEVDFSLSDFAADMRAPTPTAAAEMITPKCRDLLMRVLELHARISEYERWLRPIEQRVDEYEQRLEKSLQSLQKQMKLLIEKAEARVKSIEPQRILAVHSEKITKLSEMIRHRIWNIIESKRKNIDISAARLNSLNPLKVLDRGYSLVECGGKIISNATDLKKGDLVNLTFAAGKAKSEVTEVLQGKQTKKG